MSNNDNLNSGESQTPSQSNPVSTGEEDKKKKKDVKWSDENENILVEWADIAQCYKWLNARAHAKYSYMHAWFTIPAITLSTISGTASFAQGSLPANIQPLAPAVIGTLNIFIGILTTIQQYLKISELNEAHRVSSISWDKFARNIRIELSKSPLERMDAGPFLKICRQEFDRLMETSPMISVDIVREFNKKFRFQPDVEESKYFKQLRKPDICDIIISAERYKYGYKEPEEIEEDSEFVSEMQNKSNERITNFFRGQLEEKNKIIELKDKEEEQKLTQKKNLRNAFQKTVLEMSNRVKLQTKFLEDYVGAFEKMYGRKPIDDEIRMYAEELLSKGDIEESILTKFLEKYDNGGVMNLV